MGLRLRAAFFFGLFGSGFLFGATAFAATASTPPNDTFLNRQWSLPVIHAFDGWQMATGSRDVVVAVIDSGVDIQHEDLKENIWTNPYEVADNGKDDDGDGFIDDVHGWNFVNHTNDVGPWGVTGDADIHGTAVASLIGAKGDNGVGIAGVTWNVRIMPLVALDSSGFGTDQHIVDAINFAVSHGADVINLSLVGYDQDPALTQAVRQAAAQGVLVVAAAGNGDTADGTDLDTLPGFPACDPGVLTVSAIDENGNRAPYANYGTCVDVSAPGADMYAAVPDHDPSNSNAVLPGYQGYLTGTSVAAPLVSGLAALLKAEHPSWTARELAERIIDTADPFSPTSTSDMGLGSGVIDVAKAVSTDGLQDYGPFFLEAAAAGQSPQVRVLNADGSVRTQFYAGDPSDKRGLHATFIRWTNDFLPDVAVSYIGDTTGSYRVYRLDGVLVGAGQLTEAAPGGVTLAAQDVDTDGQDELLLTDVAGYKVWMVSQSLPVPRPFTPFTDSVAGLSALSVSRPQASFLVASRGTDGNISVIGENAVQIANGDVGTDLGHPTLRRAVEPGVGSVYELEGSKGSVVLVNDGSGMHGIGAIPKGLQWAEVPDGLLQAGGWDFYDEWPR